MHKYLLNKVWYGYATSNAILHDMLMHTLISLSVTFKWHRQSQIAYSFLNVNDNHFICFGYQLYQFRSVRVDFLEQVLVNGKALPPRHSVQASIYAQNKTWKHFGSCLGIYNSVVNEEGRKFHEVEEKSTLYKIVEVYKKNCFIFLKAFCWIFAVNQNLSSGVKYMSTQLCPIVLIYEKRFLVCVPTPSFW